MFVTNIRYLGQDSSQSKKFQVTAFSNPPAGKFQTDRTKGLAHFKVVGLDFAGHIGYKLKTEKEGKAYILLFAFSLTRAVHPEFLPKQTAKEFMKHLKRFIMRKGHARKINLYNGSSFVAAAKWFNRVVRHTLLIRFSQRRMFLWIQSNVKFDVFDRLS